MAGMNTAQQGTHSAATIAADPHIASSIEILRQLLSGQYGGLRITTERCWISVSGAFSVLPGQHLTKIQPRSSAAGPGHARLLPRAGLSADVF